VHGLQRGTSEEETMSETFTIDTTPNPRAHARMYVAIADGRVTGRKECPWCEPVGKAQRGVPLNKCKDAEHAAKLARCRQLLAEPVSSVPPRT
jgi:hypothetical protein